MVHDIPMPSKKKPKVHIRVLNANEKNMDIDESCVMDEESRINNVNYFSVTRTTKQIELNDTYVDSIESSVEK